MADPDAALERPEAIYVASRASIPERGAMWRAAREQGVPIISTWIDEDGDGATDDFSDLWKRINREVTSATRLVLYAEPGDFPLKGAFIEVGMALAVGVPVCLVLPGVFVEGRSCRPIGSWIRHPEVYRFDTIAEAFGYRLPAIAAWNRRAPTGEGWSGNMEGAQMTITLSYYEYKGKTTCNIHTSPETSPIKAIRHAVILAEALRDEICEGRIHHNVEEERSRFRRDADQLDEWAVAARRSLHPEAPGGG